MVEVLVWLLVSVSDGVNNEGNAVILEKFRTSQQCEHVRTSFPVHKQKMRCIQANILVSK